MKKYLFFVLCTLFSFSLFSQTLASVQGGEKKENEKTDISHFEKSEKKFIFNIFGGSAFSAPLNLGASHAIHPEYSLGADVLYDRRKTYHFGGFDAWQLSLVTTHGYKLKHGYGIYAFGAYSFKKEKLEGLILKNQVKISLGVEKFFKLKRLHSDVILFAEFGTHFNNNEEIFEKYISAFGCLIEGEVFKF